MIEYLIYLLDDRRVAVRGRSRLNGTIVDAKRPPHSGWGRAEGPPTFGILAVHGKFSGEHYVGRGTAFPGPRYRILISKLSPIQVAQLYRGRLDISKEQFLNIVSRIENGHRVN